MRRTAALVYGVLCYAFFFAGFLYLVGFLANLGVPKSIDSGIPGPLGTALLADLGLLLLFGLQHSVMARPAFKQWITRVLPRPVERSTYVLASTLVVAAAVAFWQPLPQAVWHFEGAAAAALWALFFGGVGLVLLASCLIDHFDLFGVRQVVLCFRGRGYELKAFGTPLLYRWIRHPLYVGWMLCFWAAPVMSAGHLLLAVVWTGYILLAIPLEERDLAATLGEPYRRWRAATPAFLPRLTPPRGVEPRPAPGQAR